MGTDDADADADAYADADADASPLQDASCIMHGGVRGAVKWVNIISFIINMVHACF